ncbi:DHA2 family efflux MFS transporter permease subunit [Actinomadura opuntiae]|uniref:DHA2 family efflux MFS transporter permease subunit n=1 Tax=Actinomadura sp. OS1-43 TaxID=604315 RepID=UPI00255AC86D|nr:DHA2 family efflux MFS transporter permease subunit [Actinomadura sp. OS1-43]MDL4815446.1 DHA2 family efflux MFS transporter permease subunit [Actinomadura sp. OS1-43]
MATSSGRRSWWGLAFMSLGILVVAVDFTVLTVALPTIATSLHASTAQLQWIMDAYTLAGAAAMLPAGVLGDRFGRRLLLFAGLVIFGGASIWSALCGSAGELIAARAVQGVGAGILLPIPLAITAAIFDDEDRPKAIGISTAAVAGGMPLGPIAGGLLLEHFSWHSVFWVNVPIIAVAFTGCLLTLPETRNPAAPRLDVVGALLAVGAIVTLVYGVINGPEHGWDAGSTIGTLACALVLITAFLFWERRVPHPLVDFTLFRNPRFSWGTLATVVATIGLSVVLFLAPIYLQSVVGDSSIGTGLRMIPVMAGMFLGGTVGPFADKLWGTKVAVVGGLLVLGTGLAVLSLVTPDSSYALFATGFVIFGAGSGGALAVAMDSAIAAVGGGEAGAGAAVTNTLRQVGGSLAYAAGGSILSVVYVRHLDPALHGLPPEAADAARDSVTGADAVAGRLGPAGAGLRAAAHTAFSDGMSAALLSTAGLCAVGALLCLWFLPARPAETVASEGTAEPAGVAQ